jgi:polygalacturonase
VLWGAVACGTDTPTSGTGETSTGGDASNLTADAGEAGPTGDAGTTGQTGTTPDEDSGTTTDATTGGPPSSMVDVYPPPPLAHRSSAFGMRIENAPVFVERHAGVSYARFAFDGPVVGEIEVSAPIQNYRVFPEEFVAASSVRGNVLRVELTEPRAFVVWIDDLEKLFVLADPREENPPIPGEGNVVSVLDHGVDPSGATLGTVAIQTAIDVVSSTPGGGVLYFPPGAYLTGTLTVKSDVTLYLAPGALLQGAPDPKDYPVDVGFEESGSDTSLPADVRYFGKTMTYSRLLWVDDAARVRITGRGTIDGEGSFLRKQHNAVPNLLRIRASSDVLLEDVLFRNAAAWTLHFVASDGIDVRNIKIINDRTNLNTDGIDPDMSTDVTIDRAFIYTKDDGVCIKATTNSDLSGDAADITVTGSVVSAVDAALKLGTESFATEFRNVVFEGNYVFESGRAMSVVVRDGALYQDVVFRNISVAPGGADHLVEQVIGVRDPDVGLGVVQNLVFEGIDAPAFAPPASNWTWYAQFRLSGPQPGNSNVPVFEGADAEHRVQGLTLRDFVVNGQHLTDVTVAAEVANITFGPFIENLTFE